MADTTTELEVLDEIVDVLGGQSGQHKTVVPVLEDIRDLLGGGGGGGGYNPALSVGRADALTGADSTAQWAQRVSTGNGAATVRSVHGAVEVQNGALVPVQIAGIASTDAQGGELDAIEWTAQTLWAVGDKRDTLTSDSVERSVKAVDLGTLDWLYNINLGGAPAFYVMADGGSVPNNNTVGAACAALTPMTANALYLATSDTNIICLTQAGYLQVRHAATTVAEFKAAMQGVMCAYTLTTPTTQPISPALPMTYRVQQGGSESIIVPDGEVSAAPVLTVAEGESAADVVMDALACIAAPDGPVATANHAINTYLTMGGKLYKVTSAIAAGESITPNTNVSETTVMAELIARTA